MNTTEGVLHGERASLLKPADPAAGGNRKSKRDGSTFTNQHKPWLLAIGVVAVFGGLAVAHGTCIPVYCVGIVVSIIDTITLKPRIHQSVRTAASRGFSQVLPGVLFYLCHFLRSRT